MMASFRLLVLTTLLSVHAMVVGGLNLHKEKELHDGLGDLTEALDTDKSGTVDENEVEAFAQTQGLSLEQAQAEFAGLDSDHDGVLEVEELHNLLKADGSSPVAPPTTAQPAEAAQKRPYEPGAEALAAPPAEAEVPSPAAATADEALAVSQAAAARAPASAASDSEKPDDLHAAQLEAERQAGKSLAEVFARTASALLAKRGTDSTRVAKYDELASSFWSRSAELRRSAVEETTKAAREAADKIIQQSKGQIEELRQQASELEGRAKQLRREAYEAAQRALKAQADVSAVLEQQSSDFDTP
uniref:EF-hand domain-containing protein n=1 Tax=Alexandrium monilatum TaxID=311494 RepID=A0A7S4Q025_9DINO